MRLSAPLKYNVIAKLRAGDRVEIDGVIYSARDAAHKRMVEALERGEPLPFEIEGQIIYYMGPSPAKPGRVIGSAGPTTSYRMDRYAPVLIERGLKAMIGKGVRSAAVKKAMVEHRAVYLAATSGAGALIAERITKADPVAYEDLGAEALLKLVVHNFPVLVVNDIYGGDLYEQGRAEFVASGEMIS